MGTNRTVGVLCPTRENNAACSSNTQATPEMVLYFRLAPNQVGFGPYFVLFFVGECFTVVVIKLEQVTSTSRQLSLPRGPQSTLLANSGPSGCKGSSISTNTAQTPPFGLRALNNLAGSHLRGRVSPAVHDSIFSLFTPS